MNTRYKYNTNLTVFSGDRYNDLPVLKIQGGLIESYLESSERTIRNALEDHPRTLAIRVDLRFPSNVPYIHTNLISKFIPSLKSQIDADLSRKEKQGSRTHACNLRYIWVREQDTALGHHYHVLLLLNLDAYNCLGYFDASEGNMAARIKRAWASALGVQLDVLGGAVHFPKDGLYRIDTNSSEFSSNFEALFSRVSYFAKVVTKNYGSYAKHFGCSRR